MRKYLAWLVAAVILGVGAGVTVWTVLRPEDDAAQWQRVVKIQEDDPRWDCHTMGNRVCGPRADR